MSPEQGGPPSEDDAMRERAPSDGIAFARHDAARGLAWLQEAFAMFSRARLPWVMLLITYSLVVGAMELVPYLGTLAYLVLRPVFAVGFLAAAWAQERGETPRLAMLFKGFQSNLAALVPIGVFLVVGVTVAVLATFLVDDGALLDAVSGREPRSPDAMQGMRAQLSMLFGVLCALPFVLAVWFAPALVVFQDARAGVALATSLRATLANWRPLLVFGMAVLAFAGAIPGLILFLAMSAFGVAGGQVALLALVPYFLFLAATLHVSDYVSYRDVFHPHESAR